MGRAIAIANQKGGVGKTTTAINLSACLAEQGKKVLVIDTDPQGNTTTGLGVKKNELKNTIYEMMLGKASFEESVVRGVAGGLDLLPANVNLSGAEIDFIDLEKPHYILRDKLKDVRKDYDFIIIDCPPSLSMLPINAMTTADSVLVTVQCEYYALDGLSQLFNTVNLIRSRMNSALEVDGIVFTMYDSRTNLSFEVVENVKNNVREHIYKTIIPRNIRLAEAPSYGQPINLYEPKSAGAEAYRLLAKEVAARKL
ncbi:MAG: AAA family ATPase [Lachnospiraceae bacterium]|nr:AAA family ATPase [Lachnospiraceae bacterium]